MDFLPPDFLVPFAILSVLAIAGAVGLIRSKNPIYSVLWLVVNFFCIAGLYLTLQAEFLAVVQIIVYAGAIMVLFLFVIMLLNLDHNTTESGRKPEQEALAVLLAFAFLGVLVYALQGLTALPPSQPQLSYGKVEALGQVLLTHYLYPFEMISVVLLAALIGAMVIAKKHN